MSQEESRVYVVHHEYERVRDDGSYCDTAKLIGVYSSEDAARLAIGRLKDKPGFRDHPDAFTIDPYPIDRDHWIDGFGDAWD